MQEQFKDVTDWIGENYPMYKGWRLRSFAWEYDVASSVQEIVNAADDANERGEYVTRSDFKDIVEKVIPPEGFAYCTFQDGNVRVGINVPCHVFQRKG